MLLSISSYRKGNRHFLKRVLVCAIACALAMQASFLRAAGSATSGPAVGHDPHHLDGGTLGETLDLSQDWLVHGGDDPAYASPEFDDSGWQPVSGHKPLSTYGIHDRPMVWYRVHVQVPALRNDLAIALQGFAGSFELYVNGVRIGQSGRMSGGGVNTGNDNQKVMRIPPEALGRGALVIAIRAAIGTVSHGEQRAGGVGSAFLGNTKALEDAATVYAFRDETATGLILMLQGLALVVLFSLTLFLRGEPEYLALTTSLSFGGASTLLGFRMLRQWLNLPPAIETVCGDLLFVLQMLAFLEFFRLVAKDGSRWFRRMQAFLLLYGVAVVTHDALYGILPDRVETSAAFPAFYLVTTLPYLVGLPTLLWMSWIKRRSYDAALLLFPVTLFCGYYGVRRVIRLLALLHRAQPFPDRIPVESLHLSWGNLVDIVVTLMLLVYILFRVVRTLRAGARYAAEVEAAQTVQQVLLSRSAQATPGFKVETVYLPASEVGGDFFFVSPGADGSLVAIVGDVAGKGMLAAMRVSAILGALSREEARLPAMILEGLNEAMLRQGDVGMTTACCIRMEPDGRFTVANAGHISPYIAGQEVATAGALPLGILSGAEYEQTEGVLTPGEHVVLLSDGVVEARSAKLGLFGFDRLGPLTRETANAIASTAKAFGQEDDITVVTVACTG